MRIMLAPMEGVLDVTLRDWLTRVGHYDRCVTEFIRVNDKVLPDKVFRRFCPELATGGKTPSGTPVYVQLLGSHLEAMSENAKTAERLGALGIDINFGCPSKTVNRSHGGSALLREPERVHDIVHAVRQSVSNHIPVTAKIRLGFDDTSLFEDIVLGIGDAQASELCIHARTRTDGYKPPAYWQHIASVREKVNIPIIVNGEIWSAEDARKAQAQSGCQDIMLGRGGLSYPDLICDIREDQQGRIHTPLTWQDIQYMLIEYTDAMAMKEPKCAANRIKQWLCYLRRQYPEASVLFQNLKRLRMIDEVRNYLRQEALALK